MHLYFCVLVYLVFLIVSKISNNRIDIEKNSTITLKIQPYCKFYTLSANLK